MKFIRRKLDPKKEWNVALLNDWHLGSKAVNEPLMNTIDERFSYF